MVGLKLEVLHETCDGQVHSTLSPSASHIEELLSCKLTRSLGQEDKTIYDATQAFAVDLTNKTVDGVLMIGDWTDVSMDVVEINATEGFKLTCLGSRPLLSFTSHDLGLPQKTSCLIKPSVIKYDTTGFN